MLIAVEIPVEPCGLPNHQKEGLQARFGRLIVLLDNDLWKQQDLPIDRVGAVSRPAVVEGHGQPLHPGQGKQECQGRLDIEFP
jgi:hypothetical protein